MKIKDTVSDILDYLNSYYPFQGDYFTNLRTTIFYQLDIVLRRDLSHQALSDLCRNGNIDWFAEPFFGVRKLKLSQLLHEYDDYRYEHAGPTPDCYAYFQINQQHRSNEAHPSSDNRYAREDDDRYAREDDEEERRAGSGDFKRQRTVSE